jgi:hypothetical protein
MPGSRRCRPEVQARVILGLSGWGRISAAEQRATRPLVARVATGASEATGQALTAAGGSTGKTHHAAMEGMACS